jgi:hypothetical protein
MGAKRDRAIIKPIDEGLKAIGIDAGAVEHVIVSHLHFDHAGNYDLFPRGRAIICRIARWLCDWPQHGVMGICGCRSQPMTLPHGAKGFRGPCAVP